MRSLVSLTGQLASVDEDLTGRENLILLARLLGLKRAAGEAARDRAARRLRARGRRRPAGQALLRRHAAAARHRRQHRRHAAADVPRRADDRARPALAQPGLGHHPRARRRGHHDAALHAVPRRGRPARRPDRGDRPRQGDRRGHARASSSPRSARARCTCDCSTPGSASEAERILAALLDAVHLEPDPAALSAPCGDGDRAAEALTALSRADIGIADFSLGQPSLDEVFLALTATPPRSTSRTTRRSRRREHRPDDAARPRRPAPASCARRSPRRRARRARARSRRRSRSAGAGCSRSSTCPSSCST